MNNKIALESMSMDLLRVALGVHRGSYKMASRFFTEALKRNSEIDNKNLRPYFVRLLHKISTHREDDLKNSAEDFLMYSVLVQNYTKKFLNSGV